MPQLMLHKMHAVGCHSAPSSMFPGPVRAAVDVMSGLPTGSFTC